MPQTAILTRAASGEPAGLRPLISKTYTRMNRYEEIFRFLSQIHEAFGLRFRTILSYGCASGEECLTLKAMFPHAKIVGTDILSEMVEKARALCQHEPDIEILPFDAFWKDRRRYDLVCCMSVLIELPFQFVSKKAYEAAMDEPASRLAMYTQVLARLTLKFPFSEFQRVTKLLDAKIRGGGIFVLHNANYRFMETSAGRKKYLPIFLPGKNYETMPKADKKGQAVIHDEYTEVIFRKRRNSLPARIRSMVRRTLRGR